MMEDLMDMTLKERLQLRQRKRTNVVAYAERESGSSSEELEIPDLMVGYECLLCANLTRIGIDRNDLTRKAANGARKIFDSYRDGTEHVELDHPFIQSQNRGENVEFVYRTDIYDVDLADRAREQRRRRKERALKLGQSLGTLQLLTNNNKASGRKQGPTAKQITNDIETGSKPKRGPKPKKEPVTSEKARKLLLPTGVTQISTLRHPDNPREGPSAESRSKPLRGNVCPCCRVSIPGGALSDVQHHQELACTKLRKFQCPQCHVYFPSKKAVKDHGIRVHFYEGTPKPDSTVGNISESSINPYFSRGRRASISGKDCNPPPNPDAKFRCIEPSYFVRKARTSEGPQATVKIVTGSELTSENLLELLSQPRQEESGTQNGEPPLDPTGPEEAAERKEPIDGSTGSIPGADQTSPQRNISATPIESQSPAPSVAENSFSQLNSRSGGLQAKEMIPNDPRIFHATENEIQQADCRIEALVSGMKAIDRETIVPNYTTAIDVGMGTGYNTLDRGPIPDNGVPHTSESGNWISESFPKTEGMQNTGFRYESHPVPYPANSEPRPNCVCPSAPFDYPTSNQDRMPPALYSQGYEKISSSEEEDAKMAQTQTNKLSPVAKTEPPIPAENIINSHPNHDDLKHDHLEKENNENQTATDTVSKNEKMDGFLQTRITLRMKLLTRPKLVIQREECFEPIPLLDSLIDNLSTSQLQQRQRKMLENLRPKSDFNQIDTVSKFSHAHPRTPVFFTVRGEEGEERWIGCNPGKHTIEEIIVPPWGARKESHDKVLKNPYDNSLASIRNKLKQQRGEDFDPERKSKKKKRRRSSSSDGETFTVAGESKWGRKRKGTDKFHLDEPERKQRKNDRRRHNKTPYRLTAADRRLLEEYQVNPSALVLSIQKAENLFKNKHPEAFPPSWKGFRRNSVEFNNNRRRNNEKQANKGERKRRKRPLNLSDISSSDDELPLTSYFDKPRTGPLTVKDKSLINLHLPVEKQQSIVLIKSSERMITDEKMEERRNSSGLTLDTSADLESTLALSILSSAKSPLELAHALLNRNANPEKMIKSQSVPSKTRDKREKNPSRTKSSLVDEGYDGSSSDSEDSDSDSSISDSAPLDASLIRNGSTQPGTVAIPLEIRNLLDEILEQVTERTTNDM